MGGHHDPTSINKNVFIEGIANYRDQIHLRFFQRLNRNNIVQFGLAAVVFPAFLWQMTATTNEQSKSRKEEFNKNYKMPQVRKETLQKE